MLIEQRINDNGEVVEYNKIEVAIARIKWAYEVSEGYGLGALYVAYSGGKDSTVLAELVKMSGVPYTLNYNVTGIDPPELVYFMREQFNAVDGETGESLYSRREGLTDLRWHKYKKSMWQLIPEKKIPPTQLYRYCCSELKERGGEGYICLTGVRWSESNKRKGRKAFEVVSKKASEKMLFNDNDLARQSWEHCIKKGKKVSNPIIDWSDAEVWEFIRQRNLPYCKLYDEGCKRLGCVGCPFGGKYGMARGFKRYPKFKKLYLLAFDKMLQVYSDESRAKNNWKTADDVFDWWIRDKVIPSKEQMSLFDDGE